MIKVVLFDVDGTLIRTGGAGVEAFGVALESEFGVRADLKKISFAGRTDLSLVRELFRHSGIEWTPENKDRFFKSYLEWLPRILPTRSGMALPGAIKFINMLECMDPPPLLGLLTGNIQKGAEIKLRFFGLWNKFRFGAFGDEHEDRNAIATAAFEKAKQLLASDLSPDEVIVVGDTPHDIACARHLGAKSLAVATGGFPKSQLAACNPDWLVDDLGTITPTTLQHPNHQLSFWP